MITTTSTVAKRLTIGSSPPNKLNADSTLPIQVSVASGSRKKRYIIVADGGVQLAGTATVSVTTVPSYPTVSNGLLWLDRFANVFSDIDGTVPASIGDEIAAWKSVGGSWGNSLATQSDSSARPLLQNSGVQPDGSNDYFAVPTLHLAGAFSVYYVCQGKPHYPDSQICSILGTTTDYPYFSLDLAGYPSDITYVRLNNYINWSSLPDISATPEFFLLRVIRTAANTFRIAATGVAEITGVGSGSWPDSWVYDFVCFGRGVSITAAPASGLYWRQLVVVDGDTIADGTDEAIRTKLMQLEGVGF